MSIVAPGSPAPAFTLKDEQGEDFTDADLRGDLITVFVFYPFAFSEVCTDQFQIYDEVLDEFTAQGARLFGVSTDATESQTAFREKLGVSIPQLSDFEPKGAAARALGAYFEPGGMTARALISFDTDANVAWSLLAEHPGILPGADLVFEAISAAKR